jgi:N-acetyl-gamma-glutamyl-phosphate reductase
VIRAGIVNVTGYIGAELARLLSSHPEVRLSWATGRSEVGKKLSDVFPYLGDIQITPEPGEADIIFSALPAGSSTQTIVSLINKGMRVIDLSADFRLDEESLYPEWYGFSHPAPHLIKEKVYGLSELYRQDIARAHLVANPGCYPAATLLALAPALREGLIQPDIVVDAKSGMSGAGRTFSLATHFAEANENLSPYALEGHRHLPEIIQEVRKIGRISPRVTFIPHLVPLTRGLLVTCYASLTKETNVERSYQEFYRKEPFVEVVAFPPATKLTLGSNLCLIHPTIDRRTGKLIVVGCLDNLIKGGAGQAIQNMNLMLGLPETLGIPSKPLYP